MLILAIKQSESDIFILYLGILVPEAPRDSACLMTKRSIYTSITNWAPPQLLPTMPEAY